METKRIIKHLKRPQNLLYRILCIRPDWIKSDKFYLKMKYSLAFGRSLDLENPKTFCEKLQWLKLYNRKPEYTTMVDKYAAKEYVANIIGEEHIIPTLAVYNNTAEIDWDALPNQFVLKTTHDSGGIVICRDKSELDKKAAIKKLEYALCHDNYSVTREWPYKNVPHRIIAEKFMEGNPNVKDLPDYKWYCFNGEPLFCQVIQDRTVGETIDFFDAHWNHQDFVGLNLKAENANVMPEKPKNLENHKRIARLLSKDIPFARIDLYDINENQYFGEITMFPASGFGEFRPSEYNELIGSMLTLPSEKRGGG